MLTPLLRTLRESGASPIDLGANAPIRLDQSAGVWLVAEGKVEIFAVSTDPAFQDRRTHLATVQQGEMFFGIGSSQRRHALPFAGAETRARKTALLAVALPDTEIWQVDRSTVAQMARQDQETEAIATAIEAWIGALFEQIPRSHSPQRFVELHRGEEIRLEEAGIAARGDRGVIWVRHLEGASRFLGRPELEVSRVGDLLPVSDAAWIVCTGPTLLSCVGTHGLLRSGSIWEGLARFHDLLLDYVELEVARTLEADREQLVERLDRDQQVVSDAYLHLASVLDTTSTEAARAPIAEGTDPLFAACKVIGAEQGIEFRLPLQGRRQPHHGRFLARICNSSRVRQRLVMLRDDWWNRDNGPLLAFLGTESRDQKGPRMAGKPVALLPTSPDSYELVEPQTGDRRPVDEELALDLEAEAFMFYPPLPERAVGIADLLKLAFRGRSRDVGTVLLMGVGSGLLALLVPILTGQLFGQVIPAANRSQLFEIVLALVVAALAVMAFQLTRSIAVLRISGKLDGSVQAAVWDRLLALPPDFYRQFTVGDLASRSMGIDQIRTLLLGSVTTSFLTAVFSSFSFALLFYYDWRLALVAALLIAGLVSVASLLVFFQVRYQRRYLELEGKVSSLVFGMLNGLSKLRVAGAEPRAFALWSRRFSEQREQVIRGQNLANLQSAINAAYGLLASLTLFAMMVFVVQSELEVSEFLAFSAAFGQFQAASLALIALFSSVLTMIPLYERLKPILATPPEVDAGNSELAELSGEIELLHVSFRYEQDGPLILDDVTIRARPGEMVALVGPSGSGKSTCLRLLLGFERPFAGSVYFDGQDLPSLDVQSVRRQMGVVLQNGRLISGSLFTNIVGNTNLGIDDAWEAARMAGLADDIEKMPMGMHTLVSEGAETFSGGQRQRLMIARAIVHRPRALLFDEATSALDNRTQEIVSQSLERLKATRIIVAHRLSTIRNADRIYVMEKGRVVETGTYEELLEQGGLFSRLAERQIA